MLKKIDNKGFSIIEVLIVLAIAGLIMLVVFLAVPALRRNAANSGRDNDASKVSSAVTDCLTNHNNIEDSCDEVAPTAVDVTGLSQLSDDITSANFILSTGTFAETPALLASGTDKDASTFTVQYKAKCSTTGDGKAVVSTNKRDFVVQYNKKTSGGVILQCIGS